MGKAFAPGFKKKKKKFGPASWSLLLIQRHGVGRQRPLGRASMINNALHDWSMQY
jgi:hypothetical protein